jgi:hypothetical protein
MNLPDKIDQEKYEIEDTRWAERGVIIYLAGIMDDLVANQNQLIDYLKEKEDASLATVQPFNRFYKESEQKNDN